MNKVRICHFSTVHIRTDVRIFYKECLSLAANGYDVHLVVADGKGDEKIRDVKIHDIGKMPNRLLRILINPFKMLLKVMSLHCRIYHFHDPELLLVCFLLKLLTKSKVIYDAHECYSEYFLHKEYLPVAVRPLFSYLIKTMENLVGSKLDQVITTTEYQAAIIKNINKHLDIVYNYPILTEWRNADHQPDAFKKRAICYIGSISEERGITQVIKAIESIDCVFHLAGSYAIPSYRNEIMQLPGWSKVIEHGYVNRNQAADIISQSMIGIVMLLPKPNHLISHSTKIFEYMAGGIACLVPDFPIWKDIVEANGCGVCVNTEDIAMISNSIDSMLNDIELTAQMGAIGRRLAGEKYNWTTQESILLIIYNRLVGDRV